MGVVHIVANLPARDPVALAGFYRAVFDLDLDFDMGWIAFLGAPSHHRSRLHLASGGGSGTDLPAISIAVDDLEQALSRLRAFGHQPVYGPVTEPWGVHRFFLRDPEGNLVNVATHRDPETP